MQRYTNLVQDNAGNALGGVTVTVYAAGTTNLATLYTTDGAGSKSNPFTNDNDGTLEFYAANGRYDVVYTKSGYTFTATNTTDIFLYDYQDHAHGIIDVKEYYALVGDGTTSDHASVAAAVAAAYAGGYELYWAAGTYLTTSSIANLHDVRHHGPGVLKRGSDLFYLEPKYGQSNTLYVSTAGSNSNDGLSSSYPTLTIQKAVDYLRLYTPLKGAWTISIAAGTYAESVAVLDHTNFQTSYLTFAGPSVATVQTTPTVIIDYPGSGSGVGLDLGQHNKVKVQNIKFTDFTLTGLNADDFSSVWAYNVHATTCLQGIVGNACRLYVQGGVLTGGGGAQVGIVVYSGATATIGYGATSTSDSTIISDYTQAGIELKSHVHVVSNYVQYNDNTIAVWGYHNARFDTKGDNFKRNTTVFKLEGSFVSENISPASEYNYDTADENSLVFNLRQFSAMDVAHETGYGGLDVAHSRASTTLTGTIGNTIFRTLYTIPAFHFQTNLSEGRYIEIEAVFTGTGAAATKTITLQFGATVIGTYTMATGTQTSKVRAMIWGSNATSVVVNQEVTNLTLVTAARSIAVPDLTVNADLAFYAAVSGAADTCVQHETRVVRWG